MKRRGFFSRLLGLAAIPLVPVIEKEKKMDVPVQVQVQDLECPPGMVCINGKCPERSPYVVGYDPCMDGVSYTRVYVLKKHGVNSFEFVSRKTNEEIDIKLNYIDLLDDRIRNNEKSSYVFYTGSLATGERKHLRDE